MQYGSNVIEGAGTLVTTDGTAVIVGTDTLWVTSPLVVAGNLFTLDGINYEIGSVDTETQITLTSAYAGPNGSGQLYVISSNFTPNYSFPYPTKGDVETAALMKNALHKADSTFADYADRVLGPATATDNAITRYDGITGKLVQDSSVTIDDTGKVVAPSLQLSGGTGTQGTLSWNTDEETLDLVNNDAVLQLGQEMYVHIRNNSGVTIPDGTPVMATGTIGASGRITIGLMDGTDPDNAKFYLGITTESIIDGDDGKVTTFGKVRGIDTTGTPYSETWAEGEVIWISTTTAGYLTNVEPTSGLGLSIAFVITGHATSGTLMSRATSMDDNAYTPIAHLTDSVDAHDASAISNVAYGGITSTDQQGVNNYLAQNLIAQTLTYNFTSDADYTLSATENLYGRVVLTDTSVFLTVARNVIVSDTPRVIYVQNDTAEVLTVKTAAGTGITVPKNTTRQLLCDGTDVIAVGDISLLAEIVISGSAVTSVDFTGLDINTHKSYRIEIESINTLGVDSILSWAINGDTTAINYYYQRVDIDDTSVTGVRSNSNSVALTPANNRAGLVINVLNRNGYIQGLTQESRGSGSGLDLHLRSLSKVSSVSNMTQLTFTSSVSGGIGVNSRFRVYRGEV